MRLDAWALNTIEHSSTANPQLVGEGFYHQFRALISEDVDDLADYDDIFEDRFENDVGDALEHLSYARSLEIICDMRSSTYYAQFIQLRRLLCTTVSDEHAYALRTEELS